MGSPLGPTLANTFLVYHKKIGQNVFHYVDDIFVLFNSLEHLKRFQSYLNFRRVNIPFTIENEKDNKPNFQRNLYSFCQFLTIHLQKGLLKNGLTFLTKTKRSVFLFEIIFLKKITTQLYKFVKESFQFKIKNSKIYFQ